MSKYIVDTQLLIRAIRNRGEAERMASFASIGATVIQDNEKDFAAIQRAYPPVNFTAPWPAAR